MNKTLKELTSSLIIAVGELSDLVKCHFELVRDQNEAFLHTSDVANMLNMSVRTIERYARRGIIYSKRIGGTNFFRKSDVIALLNNR